MSRALRSGNSQSDDAPLSGDCYRGVDDPAALPRSETRIAGNEPARFCTVGSSRVQVMSDVDGLDFDSDFDDDLAALEADDFAASDGFDDADI